MYLLQSSVLRTWAPRNGNALWRVWVQFSAMHSAPWSGNMKFISAGASVPGVFWKTMRTPSTVSSVPVAEISSVGAIRSPCARGIVLPSPLSMCPRGPGGTSMPNW